MNTSPLRQVILVALAAPLLAACTGSLPATSVIVTQPPATSAASVGGTSPAAPSAPTASPVTVTASAMATTTATRTVTASPSGKGTVRVSATGLAFVTPSGRIACYMDANYTECEYEAADRLWTAPTGGPCPMPSGGALIVDYEVAYGLCSGSPLAWNAVLDDRSMQPVGVTSWWQQGDPTVMLEGQRLAALPYGTSLVLGAYRCDSSSSGVRCANQSTGHGFSLSREAYRVY